VLFDAYIPAVPVLHSPPEGSKQRGGGRHPHARSPLTAFLRSQRAAVPEADRRARLHEAAKPDGPASAHPRNTRFCFIPGTPLSFHLQGLDPPGDRRTSPPLILPCRWATRSDATVGFEGFVPPDSRSQHRRSDAAPCPPGVLPSEALPSAAVAPASRLLLSRASLATGEPARQAAPQSLDRQRIGFSRPHPAVQSLRPRPRKSESGTGPSGVSHLVASPASQQRPEG
jgi:hypothetical protein